MILVGGYALRHFSRTRYLIVACGAVFAVQWSSNANLYRILTAERPQVTSEVFLTALTLFPDDAGGKKVFNCEWDAAPYILYARPDMRVVDVLDPALLWLHDPLKYALRQRLIAGQSPTPGADLREYFKADFVLCASAALNEQLKAEPAHFDLLASANAQPSVAIFRVKRE
jgi:hypothetical protein